MRLAVFSTKPYERPFFGAANRDGRHEIVYHEARLLPETAALAGGLPAVSVFVNDVVNAAVIETLAAGGTRLIAARSAGYNHIDLRAAREHGVTVARVPAYSPHAVAEFTVGLILALNRGIHRASGRVRDGNFSLDGLLGYDLAGRTAGIVGTGQIGAVVARILRGFDLRVLAHDTRPDASMPVEYVPLDELLRESDIVTLHAPLTRETHHLIDAARLGGMKRGAMLINTSRGGLVDAAAVIEALKSGQLGHVGLDVYEEEGGLFFEDQSNRVLQDDIFARLLTFPNVLVTGHQAFFTREAMEAIARVTLENVAEFEREGRCGNAVEAG